MNNEPVAGGIPPVLHETTPPLPADARPTVMLESLLKQPQAVIGRARLWERQRMLGVFFATIVVCTVVYGIVIGTFAGGRQLWAAPLKLTVGILVSAVFCLPGLYIAASLGGRDVKLPEVATYLLAMVTLTTVLLVGFAPAAWLFSASTRSLVFIGTLHLLIWMAGMAAGLRLLRQALGGLRGHVALWCVMFVLVCLQMTTALRPLVGTASHLLPTEKKFFVEHWWDCLRHRP